MRKRMFTLIKSEAVLIISSLAAVITMFFVPPDAQYIHYIDIKVIVLLFCLMAVVQGFVKNGFFDVVSKKALSLSDNSKTISFILIMLVFFSAMFVTNDVALITFVPLTFGILGNIRQKNLIFTVVMETLAANLGGMSTPFGSPHNLFVYTFYHFSPLEFFKTVIPPAVLGFIIISVIALVKRFGETAKPHSFTDEKMPIKPLVIYSVLFVISVLGVLNVIPYYICLPVVLITILIADRAVLKSVDYFLLITFVAFFIFVGNLGRIDAVRDSISQVINGSGFFTGLILSQVISNVPAAVMLSGFTENSKALLLGVNIGGLGTLVASLASLISFKLYIKTENSKPLQYILIFTVYNFAVMAALVGFVCLAGV